MQSDGEGRNIISATRRPDGTLRKERRIRPGYVPQEEQEVYVSKGAMVITRRSPASPPPFPAAHAVSPCCVDSARNLRKLRFVATQLQRDAGRVPGFDPSAAQAIKAAAAASNKSKAAKKNEKRKEKKHAAAAVDNLDSCDNRCQSAPETALQRLDLGADAADTATEPAKFSEQRAALEKQLRALRKKVRQLRAILLNTTSACRSSCLHISFVAGSAVSHAAGRFEQQRRVVKSGAAETRQSGIVGGGSGGT